MAAGGLDFFPASEIDVGPWRLFVVEDRASGDAGLLVDGTDALPVTGAIALGGELQLLPLRWDGLAALKNLVQKHDPGSTVFPVARGTLSRSSLGIGARFTTLHWPAVAWVMQKLGLSLTANQNSIPRELVYDVDAMLEDRLAQVPFPFIGGSVPEGHQGQSVEGMSHASVLAFLKVGFHRHRIPWGFNADHQPIGGRFDAIEEELARGCAFASYITFDLSPELALHKPIEDPVELEGAFAALGEPELFRRVVATARAPRSRARRDTGQAPVHVPAAGDAQAREARRGVRPGPPGTVHRGGGPPVLPGALDRRVAGPHDARNAGALPGDGGGAGRRDPLRGAGHRFPEELSLFRQR